MGKENRDDALKTVMEEFEKEGIDLSREQRRMLKRMSKNPDMLNAIVSEYLDKDQA